jgi:hypothetical protein
MSSDAVAKLSANEAQNLIFLSGVSTADRFRKYLDAALVWMWSRPMCLRGRSISIDSKLGRELRSNQTTFDSGYHRRNSHLFRRFDICGSISSIVEIIRLKSDKVQE